MRLTLRAIELRFVWFLLCIKLLRTEEFGGGGNSPERHALTATAGQLVTISERHLPPPTDHAHLEYHVTRPLLPEDGHLLLMYAPGLEVSQFTHEDVRRQDVVFVAPPPHLVPQERTVYFKFTTDHVTEATFNVMLLPLGHREPSFTSPNPTIKLPAKGNTAVFNISRKYLEVQGLQGDDVSFMLTEPPSHGELALLFYDGDVLVLQPEEQVGGAEIARCAAVQYRREDFSARQDRIEVLATDSQAEAVTQITLHFEQDSSQQVETSSREEVVALHVNEGERMVLTSDYFSYALSGGGGRSRVSYTLLDSPHYGALTISSGSMERALGHGDIFTQDDANKGRLAYRALAEVGRHLVTERIPLRIADSTGSRYRPQLLAITVEPTDNQAPLVLVNGELVVREGGEQVLSADLITLIDVDSVDTQLLLVLEAPPTFGHLQIGDESSATRFSGADLRNGDVRYVQSVHRGTEPTRDVLVFYATDGINRSPTMRVNVSIELVNDEAPTLMTDTLEVEGASVVTNSSLFVTDFDTPASALLVTLLQEPTKGEFRLRESRHRPFGSGSLLTAGGVFSYSDVLEERLTFIPTVTSMTSDSAVFSVSDGEFSAQASLHIQVVRSGTMLHSSQSTSVRMRSGDTLVLSQLSGRRLVLLQAPATGLKLQRKSRDNTWTDLHPGDYVTHQDRLLHTSGANVFTVRFGVEDSDGQHTGNLVLIVTVSEELAAPTLTANHQLLMRAGDSAVINSGLLSVADLDTTPENVIFTVTRGAQSGHLSLENKGETVSWSQADLDAGRLRFNHRSLSANDQDNFLFTVSDQTTTIDGEFSVRVMTEDEPSSQVEIRALTAGWGENTPVSNAALRLPSIVRPESAVFQVTLPPRHGKLTLRLNDADFVNTASFSLRDLAEGRVFYSHNPSAQDDAQDDMQMSLSCAGAACQLAGHQGTLQTQTITLPIIIRRAEAGAPSLVTNNGISYLQYVNGKGVGFLSRAVLRAISADASPRRVVYSVTTPPDHGLLYNSAAPNTPISLFTQEDVNQGKIFYQLDDENDFSVTEDEFEFQVMDSRSHTLKENFFHIQWSWLYFETSNYKISETDGVLRVKIHREGSVSRDASTVRCRLVSSRTHTSATWGTNVSRQNDIELQHDLSQFDGLETDKFCTIKILNDNQYEGDEYFTVELFDPSKALLGRVRNSQVILKDPEDQPTFTFKSKVIQVNETEGPVKIHVYRTGDSREDASIRCVTSGGSARGSDHVTNHADFVTRADTDASIITFQPGQHEATCHIQVVDDAAYEETEDFWVLLSSPSAGSVLGTDIKLRVQILGPNDVSQIHFSQTENYFLENSGGVDIAVTRSGPDLSHNASVWCTTHALEAQPKMDYVPMSQQVLFSRGEIEAWCRLTLLDDSGAPQLEGRERMRVVLSHAEGATLVEPSSATVVLDDGATDTPTLQFAESQTMVREDAGVVRVDVHRSGDTRQPASVKCYTSARSAREGEDFQERPKTERSRVMFSAGQSVSVCAVNITDDDIREGDEEFVLRLAEPMFEDLTSGQQRAALLGHRAVARVKITDQEDEPRVHFEQNDVIVNKPSEEPLKYRVKVLRSGDTSQVSSIHISSRDGTASSGSDYLAVSTVLTFAPGVKVTYLEVTILPAQEEEERKEESLQLLIDDNESSALTISIRSQSAGALVLPAQPLVTSLLHYDNATEGVTPDPGYPLVCISPCEERHPHFMRSRHLCAALKFRNVEYFWEVAVPTGLQILSHSAFKKLTKSTIFAKANNKVLDTIYFTSNFQIKCGVQPVKMNGRLGIATKSAPVTIGMSQMFCKNMESDTDYFIRNQAFNANLKYVNSSAKSNANTVHINIEIPHTDGRVPLISTQPLHNVQALLTEPLYSLPHLCSNLLLNKGFMIKSHSELLPNLKPYERDLKLRGSESVHLYSHLNLKKCVWSFDAWFDMSELIDRCQGKVASETQVGERGESELRVEVPLHVAYVRASGAEQWSAVEHRTSLQVTLTYSALLWHQGLSTHPQPAATAQVSRVWANEAGQMVLEFWTQALFHGHFVTSHFTSPGLNSTVEAPRRLSGLGFELQLVRSEGARQLWRATANASLADFSGDYVANLLPCVHSGSDVTSCEIYPFTKVALQVTFQAPPRPLPAKLKLRTNFEITKNSKHFLADPTDPQFYHQGDEAWRFGEGERVLGRVSWHSSQDLRDAYRLDIERVLVCAARQGETLDPSGDTLGCLLPSQALAHRFVLLDREHPDAADAAVRGVQFNARFARDVPEFSELRQRPGVDGFVWKVDPLYQLAPHQHWYMQVLYRIHGSAELERVRRASDQVVHEGSAMKPLLLQEESEEVWGTWPFITIPLICAVACLLAWSLHRRLSRDSYSLPPSS